MNKTTAIALHLIEPLLHKGYTVWLDNAMIIYRHNTGHKTDQLAFTVNLVEALFEQFADTERKVTGRRAPENTIPRLLERYFINKVSPTGKKALSQ
jgi:hypothetical protein